MKMIYYADIKDNLVQGYYCKEIHGDNIPATAIPITEELWQELLKLGQAEIIDQEKMNLPSTLNQGEEEFAFGMDMLDNFKQHIVEREVTEGPEYVSVETRMTNLEEKFDALSNQLAQAISLMSEK